jgi:hypothetical protein
LGKVFAFGEQIIEKGASDNGELFAVGVNRIPVSFNREFFHI